MKECTYENTPKFSMRGVRYGKIVKVYDGDTITAAIQIDNAFRLFNCRLLGYNSPEMRTGAKARRARDKLISMVLGKIVALHCEDFDKYGRILVNVYSDDIHVNNEMRQFVINQ